MVHLNVLDSLNLSAVKGSAILAALQIESPTPEGRKSGIYGSCFMTAILIIFSKLDFK